MKKEKNNRNETNKIRIVATHPLSIILPVPDRNKYTCKTLKGDLNDKNSRSTL